MLNALAGVISVDQEVILTNDPKQITECDRMVLPGVGAFAECRRRLFATGMMPTVQQMVDEGRPILGVCVGMQILADEGHEFETTAGLSWIPGITRRLRCEEDARRDFKLPHVGWTPVVFKPHELFRGIEQSSYFYFVHSYTLECRHSEHVMATANYGEQFAAAVVKKNIFGCQFHPEKSADAGLKLLEAFCRWQP